ncbi:MAG TPA: universal stress protein [Polyangiaceae bacterium]
MTTTDTGQSRRFQHLLVPTDFGEPAGRALTIAVDLATKWGSALTLLHTYEIPGYAYPGAMSVAVDLLTPVRDAAQARLDKELAELRRRLPRADAVLCVGAPGHEIERVIRETRVDLVVMGTHGRHGLDRVLIGSVAEKVVRLSPVPVLTVH